jgi:ribosome-binding factor A
MGNTRADRVGALIFEEVSLVLIHRLEDPRLKGVSITRVRMTRDLKTAYIYYSLIGDDKKALEAGQAFEKAKGVLRRRIGQNLGLRYVPDLEFHHDKNLDHADRIDQILKEIHDQEPDSDQGGD